MKINYKKNRLSEINIFNENIPCNIPKQVIEKLLKSKHANMERHPSGECIILTIKNQDIVLINDTKLKKILNERDSFCYANMIILKDNDYQKVNSHLMISHRVELINDTKLLDFFKPKDIFSDHPTNFSSKSYQVFKHIHQSANTKITGSLNAHEYKTSHLFYKKNVHDTGPSIQDKMMYYSLVNNNCSFDSPNFVGLIYDVLSSVNTMSEFEDKIKSIPMEEGVGSIDYKYTDKGYKIEIFSEIDKMKCIGELNFDKLNKTLSCTNETGTSYLEERHGKLNIRMYDERTQKNTYQTIETPVNSDIESENILRSPPLEYSSSRNYRDDSYRESAPAYRYEDSKEYNTSPPSSYQNDIYVDNSPSPSFSPNAAPSYDPPSYSPPPSSSMD